MRLYILRHATSERDHRDGDSARTLTGVGIEHAKRLSGWVAAHPPGSVVTSSAARAQETARLVCAGLDVKIDVRPQLYGAEAKEMLASAGHAPALVVGHNPTCEDLGRMLVPDWEKHVPRGLRPCDLVVIEVDGVIGRFICRVSPVEGLWPGV